MNVVITRMTALVLVEVATTNAARGTSV